jgi:hypothetical protein
MKGESSASSSGQNTPNGTMKMDHGGVEGSKKRKRRSRGSKTNGTVSRRRLSVSKPARDPRDEASPARPVAEGAGTRSPSPVIDFDGLSRPSKFLPLSCEPLPHTVQAEEPANVSTKLPNKPLLDSISSPQPFAQSSNALAKTQIERDC